jgi:hypothetical protein
MGRRNFFISTIIIVLACTALLQAQSDPVSPNNSSSKPGATYTPHKPSPSLSPRGTAKKLFITTPNSQPTDKVESTKPYSREDRNPSALQPSERTKSAKEKFLALRGFKRLPPGYKVDYIVPLSQGGRDAPENMQLVPETPPEEKTAGKQRSK